MFVSLLGLVSCWWFNSLTGPVYFANQASGDLGPNLVSHIITCVVGILLGNALGFLLPQWGVALAASIAIISGGAWLLRRYVLNGNSISIGKILYPGFMRVVYLLIACVICTLIFTVRLDFARMLVYDSLLLILSGAACLFSLQSARKHHFNS